MTTSPLTLRPVRLGNRPFRPARLITAYRKLRILGARGLALLLLNKLTGRVSATQVRLPGAEFPAWIRIGTTDLDVCWQIFQTREFDINLRDPRVIIDGGAYIGLSAAWFANRYPMATVYAVEMEPSNFALLDLNAASYQNIVPIRAAIGGKVGELTISDPGTGHWGFRAGESGGGETVHALTIDRIMADHGLHHVDVLKLDIEGSEVEVFADPSAWIDRVDSMVIELHEGFRPGCTAVFEEATRDFPIRSERGENTYCARVLTR